MDDDIPKKDSLKKFEESTESKIIIRCNEQSYSFDKKSYNEKFLGHILYKGEWDAVISEASKIIGSSWGKKRMKDKVTIPRFLVIFALLSVLLTFIYMIFLYLSTTNEGESTAFMAISVVSVCSSLFISLALAIYNFYRKLDRFRTLDEIIKEDMERYLNKLNLTYKGKLEFVFIPILNNIECNILRKRDRSEDNHFLIGGTEENLKENEELPMSDRVLQGENAVERKHSSKKHSRVQSMNISNK
jgi:hypothetical protein